MTTHKEECEKNELILRQRQLIEKLTLENASLKAHIRGKVKPFIEVESFPPINDITERELKNRRMEK